MPGNTSDRTTLREFLRKIEAQYGKAQRIWVRDRGIPTEEVLEEMRAADPPVYYLLGTGACAKKAESPPRRNFSFRVNRSKLRQVRRREGRYLLRTNLCGRNPEELWQFYVQLTEIEAAFKNLKDDLELRPIKRRAHLIFVAYGHVHDLAPELARRVIRPHWRSRVHGIIGVKKPCDAARAGRNFGQHLDASLGKFTAENGDARNVSSGARQAFRKTTTDGIVKGQVQYRDRRRCELRGASPIGRLSPMFTKTFK